jgi:predicted phosphodiesterase
MKVQYMSDLHLEFRGMDFKELFRKNGDILCLAGDICLCGAEKEWEYFTEFIRYVCKKYQHVIHVPGNHEYYVTDASNVSKDNTMQGIDRRLRSLDGIIDNYHYLNCRTFELALGNKKYRFHGAALWSRVEKKNKELIQESMNDYEFIFIQTRNGIKKFNVDYMTGLHRKHLNFIRNVVKCARKDKNTRNIIITHHKPLVDSAGDAFSNAYESDLSNVIKSPIDVSIHGHTHQRYNKVVNGVLHLSNPKGYPHQKTCFTADKIIVL